MRGVMGRVQERVQVPQRTYAIACPHYAGSWDREVFVARTVVPPYCDDRTVSSRQATRATHAGPARHAALTDSIASLLEDFSMVCAHIHLASGDAMAGLDCVLWLLCVRPLDLIACLARAGHRCRSCHWTQPMRIPWQQCWRTLTTPFRSLPPPLLHAAQP